MFSLLWTAGLARYIVGLIRPICLTACSVYQVCPSLSVSLSIIFLPPPSPPLLISLYVHLQIFSSLLSLHFSTMLWSTFLPKQTFILVFFIFINGCLPFLPFSPVSPSIFLPRMLLTGDQEPANRLLCFQDPFN